MLNVYAIEQSEIYGHGNRLVIWFSGCSLHCKGCINSNLWDKKAGHKYTVNQLLEYITMTNNVNGVTYIGGEPLEQGIDLLTLSKEILNLGLDIVLFTGYELNELNDLQRKIWNLSAIIICGRYIQSKRDTNLLLRGSSNQRIVINDKHLTQYYTTEQKQVEIEITAEDNKYLGFPEDFL